MRTMGGYSKKIYNKDFYEKINIERGADGGARQIVPIVKKIMEDNSMACCSVADVGCGTGIWLNEFKKNGCHVHGFDGNIYPSTCILEKNEYEVVDFTSDNGNNERYDLAVSLEVAEHIPEEKSKHFLDFLTSLSDIILFSAAVPNQGGQGHVNEQWPSYWVKRLDDYGYTCLDIIRDKIWNDSDIWFFYKQNILLFVKRNDKYNDFVRNNQKDVLDLVHPEAWMKVNNWIPTKAVLTLYNNPIIYNIYQKAKNTLIRRKKVVGTK